MHAVFSVILRSFIARQKMAQLVALRGQIANVFAARRHRDGNSIDDRQAIAFQTDALGRVVRQQTHAPDSKIVKDLRAHTVVALIRLEPQHLVGDDRVGAMVLQVVCPELVHQPDASAFLAHIEKNAESLLLDHPHGMIELLAAIAAQ